jgi:hypothetical protein
VDAVVAAGRREDQPAHAELLERVHEADHTVGVDLPGELRVLRADGVTDKRGQQHDVLGVAECPHNGRPVTQVAADEREAVAVE